MNHLELLNSLLALRFQQPGWRPVLAEHGYLVYAVGVSFRLADGTIVASDLLLSNPERSTSLLVEVKGGKSIDEDQLGRMLRVTPQDLRDFAHVSLRNVAESRVGVVEVCNQEHFGHFVSSLQGRPVSVLGFDGTRFRLGGAPWVDSLLAAALESLSVAPRPPLAMVPFDRETPIADVARVVLPEVVALLVQGSGTISQEGIVRRTHTLCYDAMRTTGTGGEVPEIHRRVADVLREAASQEFSEWLQKIPTQPLWRFKKGLPADQAGKTRELKALKRACSNLIERLGGSRTLQPGLWDSSLEESNQG